MTSPSQTTTSLPSSPQTTNPIDRFAEHCHIFYNHSLSENGETPKKALTPLTKSILEAFQTIVTSDDIVPPTLSLTNDEFIACGLQNLPNNPDLIGQYQKIRDDERRKAHQTHMKTRHDILRKALTETDIDPPMKLTQRHDNRRLRDIVKEYVRRYKADFGLHPFLAGVRNFLSRQLTNERVLRWRFDGAVLSESLMRDSDFLVLSVTVLKSFLVEVRDVEDATFLREELCWEVERVMSDENLRRVLDLLPSEASLEGRPTGKVEVTAEQRSNVGGELDEKGSFLDWDLRKNHKNIFKRAHDKISRDMQDFANRTQNLFERVQKAKRVDENHR